MSLQEDLSINTIASHQKVSNKNHTRIFLIDNDSENIQDYCNFLCEFGYNATGTANLNEAFEILQVTTYDMLIFSTHFEGVTTEELIERIKKVHFGQITILLIDDTSDLLLDDASDVSENNFPSSFFIHAYYHKSSDLWTLLSLVDSLNKNILLTEKVNNIKKVIDNFIDKFSFFHQFHLPENLIATTLSHLVDLARAKAGFIQVNFANGVQEDQTLYKGIGKYDVSQKDFYAMISLDLKKKIVETKKTSEITTLDEGLVFPLIGFNNSVIGIIFVEMSDFEDNVCNLLRIFTRQASSLINNAMLHGMLDRQSEELMRTNAALNKSYLEVIEALRLAVDAKDRYTSGHSERVARYAIEIAKKLGLSGTEIENIRLGGIFHDIGKIAVSDEILLKPSRLTDEEYAKIKIHPSRGGEILSGISIFKDVIPIVEGHHEYMNGRGYPRGLQGDEICIGAKIMALADAFDAMTSNREYHKKITFDDALERLERSRGEQFADEVIDAFTDILVNSRPVIQEIADYK
ncbi:MAG: HD domain-containing phosphohydrolase [Treponemataceae bacterium]